MYSKKKLVYSYKNLIRVFKFNINNKYLSVNNFHRIELSDACMIIIKNINENKYLVLKEYRAAFNTFSFGLPGGFVEKNEDPKKTIIREVLEEVNIKIFGLKRIFSYVRNGNYYAGKESIYEAKTSDSIKLKKKNLKFYWYSKKKILRLIKNKKLKTPGLIASFLFYFKFVD